MVLTLAYFRCEIIVKSLHSDNTQKIVMEKVDGILTKMISATLHAYFIKKIDLCQIKVTAQ